MADRRELAELLKVVCAFIARPESEPFRHPVPWKEMGLTDYPLIVRRPMDLGTIKQRLEHEEYNSMEEAAADIRLVWTNCMSYNQDGSEFYFLADTFARKFEEIYATMRRTNDGVADSERVPTMDERMQLSYDIFKIDNVKLGRALTIIEDACPSAINRRAGEDEVLVNFDAMTPSCFHEVATFVQSCLSAGSKSKKKRPSDTGQPPAAMKKKVAK